MMLLPLEHWESVCKQILHSFEVMAPGFYEEADRLQGGIYIENRQNRLTFYPFVSVSIAVKPIPDATNCRSLDIAGELSELKHQAKKSLATVCSWSVAVTMLLKPHIKDACVKTSRSGHISAPFLSSGVVRMLSSFNNSTERYR